MKLRRIPLPDRTHPPFLPTRVLAGITLLATQATCFRHAIAQPCITEIEIPDNPPPGTEVRKDIAITPDGAVWFTQLELNRIGRFNPKTNQFANFDIPTFDSRPHSIDVDSQGTIWFTEINADQIGELDQVTGVFTEHPTPTRDSKPYGLAIDKLDRIWFTEMNVPGIGMLDPLTGVFTEWKLDPTIDSATNIAVDRDGSSVWITQLQKGRLLHLDPKTEAVERFPIPGPANPHSLAIDPLGNIWFSDLGNDAIGRLNLANKRFKLFKVPSPDADPHGMILDARRKAIWFTEVGASKVAVLFPLKNKFIELSTPTNAAGAYFVARSPVDDEIWFTEGEAPNIGRLPCTAR